MLVILVVLGLPRLARVSVRGWDQARGYEYEWIAMPLAGGQGFSFDAGSAWLGPYEGVDYTPTAWVEPLQTAIMAGCFYLFGEHGRLVLVLLNVLWTGLAALLITFCAGRDRLRQGMLGAALFLAFEIHVTKPWLYIGNTALAKFLLALVAVLLFRAIMKPSNRAILCLGTAIGLTNWAHAGSLLFGMATGAVILATSLRAGRAAWTHSLTLAIMPLVIIAPWTVRNYVVFGELVPIRTGFGWTSYLGNVGLSMTLPDGVGYPGDPPWSAASIRDAVDSLRLVRNERSLRQHLMVLTLTDAPRQYYSFNEAQRDRYFGSLARTWMGDHRLLMARFVLAKTRAFFFGWEWPVTAVTLLAIAGFVVHWRDARAGGLLVLIAAFAVPYSLAMPFYYRYRMPIEPLVFMLIVFLFCGHMDSRRFPERRFVP